MKFKVALLFAFMVWTLKSQIYLTENFESAFTGTPAAPPGWTQTRVVLLGDGNPEPSIPLTDGEKDWERNTNIGPATWSIAAGGVYPAAAVSGSNVLYINDYYFGSTTNAFGTRRLETPVINLSSSTNPYVRFFMFTDASSSSVPLRIVASNDGGVSWRIISLVPPNVTAASINSLTPWQRINIRIPNDFKVSNAKIGIEFTNTWVTYGVYIDDFSVEEFTPTTVTSIASGGWNNPANWSSGTVPTSDNDVVIAAGHTIQVDCNIARCQNLTINGMLTYSSVSTSQLMHVMGNASVASTGTLFSGSGTTGKRMYFSGDLVNNGVINFQPGTSITGALYWIGYQHNYSGTGIIFNNRVPIVVHAAGLGVNYLNTFTISNTCALHSGTVQANNLVLGGPPASAVNTLERYFGSFVGSPTFNNTNVTTRNISYITPIGSNGIWLAFPQQVTIPGNEIELIGGNRHITGTLLMNTHNNVQLNYPLIVGTATSGGITLTRGIIQTTSTNILVLNTNIAGATGTAPSTVTSNGTNGGTHGSYVDGPVRINFPATGTTNRVFPIGKGFAFHTNLPSTNIRRPLTIVSNGVAWNSQTITASVENAPSGPVNAPLNLIMGNLSYRLNYNGGPGLSPNAAINLFFENSTFASFDNLLGDLADIRIAQAPSLSGPWTERSLSTGSGPIVNNTLYSRTTATVSPGPINGDEYFAWASVGNICSGTPTAGTISGTNNLCFGASTTLSLTGASSGVGISYQWAVSTSTSGPFTNLGTLLTQSTGTMANTMYYIVTTSCSTSGSTATTPIFTLNVNPLANISVTATSLNYCGGPNGPTLTASGAASYTWSPAASLSSSTGVNVVATPSTSTTYSIVGTTSAGCSGPASTITIATPPTVASLNISATPSSICSGSSATLSAAVVNNTVGYCIPAYSSGSGSGDYTNLVALNTLSNSASGPLPTPFYTLYPQSLHTTTLNAGSVYTITVQSGSYNGTFNFGIFIDFNQNGNLSDAGEKIAQINGTGSFVTTSATFAVPNGATNGDTRLRVRNWYFNTNIDPCSQGGFGETEDYIITITGGVNPTNTFTWTPAANLSSPNASVTAANNLSSSTVFTLNAINQFGCPGSGTVQVNVNPSPTISVNSASVCQGNSATLTASGASSYTWNTGSNNASISANPSVTTVYTVTGSNGTCTANQTATITVNALPSVSLSAAQNTACLNGPTISLNGSPSGGVYTGSNVSGSSFNPINTGTFIPVYSYTDASTGCSNNATITIVVNALPGVSLTAAQNTACVNGSTISLTGSPAGGVYTGSNVTGSSFNPANTGTFTPVYSYTDSSTGCSNSASVTIVVSTCAGFENYELSSGIQIVPNPNNGLFHVKISNTGFNTLRVLDLTGKVILNKNISVENSVEVNLTEFAKGMYILKIIGNEKEENFRIIKQ
ncbi:MAG: T9SS type A sorting domain-containing protein [Bacteroidia bacterium]|nr:T9SS type A sorting domain-containing protein [Bacteroidia bacterium]